MYANDNEDLININIKTSKKVSSELSVHLNVDLNVNAFKNTDKIEFINYVNSRLSLKNNNILRIMLDIKSSQDKYSPYINKDFLKIIPYGEYYIDESTNILFSKNKFEIVGIIVDEEIKLFDET